MRTGGVVALLLWLRGLAHRHQQATMALAAALTATLAIGVMVVPGGRAPRTPRPDATISGAVPRPEIPGPDVTAQADESSRTPRPPDGSAPPSPPPAAPAAPAPAPPSMTATPAAPDTETAEPPRRRRTHPPQPSHPQHPQHPSHPAHPHEPPAEQSDNDGCLVRIDLILVNVCV